MKYLIEKLWIDPLENLRQNAYGYKPLGYVDTEEEAKAFCATGRLFTGEDCWALDVGPAEEVKNAGAQYRYRPLEHIQLADSSRA
jgi:hypothetical protein